MVWRAEEEAQCWSIRGLSLCMAFERGLGPLVLVCAIVRACLREGTLMCVRVWVVVFVVGLCAGVRAVPHGHLGLRLSQCG